MSSVGSKKISKFVSTSSEETEEIGRKIAHLLAPDATVCLTGDLGAGKTTLSKGIASEITGIPSHEVNSPTFTYLNIYEGKQTLYHFDCYRLENEQAFLGRGLDEYFEGLCLIEWPERIEKILPKKQTRIHIETLDETKRRIVYEENSF